jgi:Putative transposase/Transposase zinc-binding domain
MLACGNPEQSGSSAYRCLHCGQGTPLVAMRGKSSLCLRCAKVSADTWVDQVSQVLPEGVIYRHIILTVPAMFRTTFSQHAAVVLRAFMRCGRQCLEDFSSTVKGTALQGGSITVLHPHGRSGQSHPPRHGLATSGGSDTQGARWEPLPYVPSALLRRTWQWHLLTMLRQRRKTEAIEQWVDVCGRTYPDGWVPTVHKGHVPAQAQRVARSVAQYVVSPPIAVRRIDRDDGARGTDHDRSHRTDRLEYETVPVDTLLGRMVQHTMPKGLQRLRSDGVQATKTLAKGKAVLHAALAKVEEVVKGAVTIIARFT